MKRRKITIRAPAKINLSLRILRRRADGFHDIHSVFHAIGLADTLVVTINSGGANRITVTGNNAVTPRDDLCYRAAAGCIERLSHPVDINIDVAKCIPIGGGLGGGSSDAAAVAMAIAGCFPDELPIQTLHEICAGIGSDVPFFLHTPAAVVTGRGEVITPCDAAPTYPVIIVDTGHSVSTADAYRRLDEYRRIAPALPAMNADPAVLSRPPSHWNFSNDFTPVVAKLIPDIDRWIRRLRSLGAAFAGLTGTGGCVFGVFDDVSVARHAHSQCNSNTWLTNLLESWFPRALE